MNKNTPSTPPAGTVAVCNGCDVTTTLDLEDKGSTDISSGIALNVDDDSSYVQNEGHASHGNAPKRNPSDNDAKRHDVPLTTKTYTSSESYNSATDLIGIFVNSLLTINEDVVNDNFGAYKVDVVESVNLEDLRNKCHPGKSGYDPNLADIDDLSNKLFRVGTVWKNRQLVKDVVDTLASIHGFTTLYKKKIAPVIIHS